VGMTEEIFGSDESSPTNYSPPLNPSPSRGRKIRSMFDESNP